MKDKYIIAIVAGIIALLAVSTAIFHSAYKKEKAEKERYKSNTEVLFSDVEKYKVQDSLSAAKIESLDLTIKEFEKFRAEDAQLIKSLRTKNRDLQAVSDAQTRTIMELLAKGVDTLIIRDSVPIMAKSFKCGDPWYDFEGVVADDILEGKLECRDSLIVAQTVEYKRFLGFLWKTKKEKNNQIDVVSRNPHTEIQDIQFVLLKK